MQTKTIAQVLAEKQKGILCAFPVKNTEKFTTSAGYTVGHNMALPAEAVILKVMPYYMDKNGKPEAIHMQIMGNGDTPQAVVVPSNFVLNILPPEKAKALYDKFIAYRLSNLAYDCQFSGRIGSDPEIFVEDKDGGIIPAFDFLGSKKNPTKAPSRHSDDGYGNGYEIKNGENNCYWDGFQAEFETADSFCMGWHGDSIQCGLEGVWLAAKKHNPNARLSAKTVMDIPPEMLASAKPEHVAFGCMPSLNAYGMKGLDLPGNEVPYRASGGHVHLSFSDSSLQNPETYKKMVKALDAILGVAGVSLFAGLDDPRRRLMYGLAGEYRLPPHGLEYRVLSNAWLYHPLLANIVFDLARTAAMFGARDLLQYWDCSEAETVRIINNCDVEAARAVLKKNKELFIRILNVKYGAPARAEYAYNAIINGYQSVIADVTAIEKNWNLGKKWKDHCDGDGKNVVRVFEQRRQKDKV